MDYETDSPLLPYKLSPPAVPLTLLLLLVLLNVPHQSSPHVTSTNTTHNKSQPRFPLLRSSRFNLLSEISQMISPSSSTFLHFLKSKSSSLSLSLSPSPSRFVLGCKALLKPEGSRARAAAAVTAAAAARKMEKREHGCGGRRRGANHTDAAVVHVSCNVSHQNVINVALVFNEHMSGEFD